MASTATRQQNFKTNQKKQQRRNSSWLSIRHDAVPSQEKMTVFWSSFQLLLHSLQFSYTDYHLKDLMREISLALAGNAPDDSRVCDEDLWTWADVMSGDTCWHQCCSCITSFMLLKYCHICILFISLGAVERWTWDDVGQRLQRTSGDWTTTQILPTPFSPPHKNIISIYFTGYSKMSADLERMERVCPEMTVSWRDKRKVLITGPNWTKKHTHNGPDMDYFILFKTKRRPRDIGVMIFVLFGDYILLLN